MRLFQAQDGRVIGGIEAAIAELASDTAAAGILSADAAIVAWEPTFERVLWRSDAAAAICSAVLGEDRRVRFGSPASRRLREAADGLPTGEVRVRRLRLDRALPASLVALRRIEVEGGTAILTVFLDPTASAREEGSPRPAMETVSVGRAGSSPAVKARGSLLDRVRRQGIRRFVWSLDRDGRFTSVSPSLAEVVGDVHADIVGRAWSDLLGRIVLDEPGTVGSLLERRMAWSGETVLWRVADTAYVVPVDLGGMPVFDRDRAFEGFRGFGLCRTEEAHVAPDLKDEIAQAESRADAAGVAEAGTAADEGELRPAGSARMGSDAVSFQGIQARVGGQLGSARPVPLRAVDADRAGGEAQPDGAAQKPMLSRAERGALHEIARALGARFEADEAAALAEAEDAGDPPAASAATDEEPEAARVLDRLPAGILVLRGEAPLYANRFALRLLGYADLADLSSRGGVKRLFAGRLDVRSKPGEGATPLSLIARTGSNVQVEVKLTTVEWGGAPASLLLVRPAPEPPDAAVARSLELELSRRDARLHELLKALDLARLGVLTVDAKGRILSLNARAETMFGSRENEVAGEGLTTLLAPESHPAAIRLLEGAEAAASSDEAEIVGRPRRGGNPAIGLRAGRVDRPGDVSVAVVARDLSEARRAEAELNAARRAAEGAASRQAEFLARVSHEIRTPLNAITGFAEIMLDERLGGIGNERYKLYLRDIHRSGSHVLGLVNDLLHLARITSGKAELAPASLDLNGIVEESVRHFGPQARQDRIVVRQRLGPGLPRIMADEGSVRQVALSLVSNAIRLTRAGGQVIVSTSVGESGEVALRVRDTGPGLSPEEVEAALEPFRQLSVTPRGDGPERGLPLAKALVEANRGRFAITSRHGGGTLVEVLLPASPVSAPVAEPA